MRCRNIRQRLRLIPETSPIRREDIFNLTPPSASPNPFQRALNYPFREPTGESSARREDHSSLRVLPDMLIDSPMEEKNPFSLPGMRILGQLQDSYIIACDSQGLLIIDQHVAHERILYEKLAKAMQTRPWKPRDCWFPFLWSFRRTRSHCWRRVMPELNTNGFQVEPFGGNSVLVRSVPAIAGESDCRKLLAEILEGLEIEERTLDVERIRDRIAVSTACRSAIKVNMPLTMEKMQWLYGSAGADSHTHQLSARQAYHASVHDLRN